MPSLFYLFISLIIVFSVKFWGNLNQEVVALTSTKDSGMDMQPEFDKNISQSPPVNYTKIASAGEIQDEIRKIKDSAKTNGQAHQPF